MIPAAMPPSLKPRKIPRQSRSGQTVAAILEATARILETQGLQGLNTNLVAQYAGVSVGSLYQYFPGKDALIVALILRERTAFLQEAQNALHEASGRQALKCLIAASVRQQLRRPALARLLDFEESRPAIAGELACTIKTFYELLCQILAREDISPQARIGTACEDISVIMQAMINAAGERDEVDCHDLECRVGRAVFGYLGMTEIHA